MLDELSTLRAQVRDLSLLSWAPAKLQVAICDALDAGLGRAQACRFWSDFMLEAFERPLLFPVIRGALALYGKGPEALYRMAPRTHVLVTRNCGTLSLFGITEHSATIRLEQLPAALCESGTFLHCYWGTCEAVLRHLDIPGDIVRDEASSAGRADFHIKW